MEQKPGDQEAKGSLAVCLWPFTIAIATALAAGLGAAIKDVGAGVGIGVGVGVVAGLVLHGLFNGNASDKEHPS
jgi:hypothetical protein